MCKLFSIAVEGSRTLVSSLEGWGNEPLYDYRKSATTISKTVDRVNGVPWQNAALTPDVR